MRDPLPGTVSRDESGIGQGADAVTRETSNVFTGILLALIITTVLDVFFRNISSYRSTGVLMHVLISHAEIACLDLFQLLVFVLVTTRFYWGTFRYNEEVPESRGTPQMVFGLAGAILVFASFYVTALVVKNPALFYPSFAIAHLIDLLWFVIAAVCLETSLEIRKVWNWYKLFDVLTILMLVILIGIGHIGEKASYVCNCIALTGLTGISLWDMCKLWPYYTKAEGWREGLIGGHGETIGRDN